MTSPVLELRGAGFGYAGRTVVRADLEVRGGEVVAVVGANGSGKSTLMAGALGLVDRYEGDTAWFGASPAGGPQSARVSYVPQSLAAVGPVPATVTEVVASGGIARRGLWRRSGTADREAVRLVLSQVGLEDLGRASLHSLSGGQQRRCLVARALVSQADVLVLDEPFSGIDTATQRSLAGVLAEFVSAGGTLMVVLHDLGPLRRLVTRSVALDHGSIVFDGSPADAPEDPAHHDHDPHGGSPEGVSPRLGLLG